MLNWESGDHCLVAHSDEEIYEVTEHGECEWVAFLSGGEVVFITEGTLQECIAACEKHAAGESKETVRVRIAVAATNRDWFAYGRDGLSDYDAKKEAIEGVSFEAHSLHFIEADVPLPKSQTIQGEVTQ